VIADTIEKRLFARGGTILRRFFWRYADVKQRELEFRGSTKRTHLAGVELAMGFQLPLGETINVQVQKAA
jgi:hypothetical protein